MAVPSHINNNAVESSLFSHPYKINPVVLTNDIYKHRFLRDFSVGRYIPNAPPYVFVSFSGNFLHKLEHSNFHWIKAQ
jgi:hypothetical protein